MYLLAGAASIAPLVLVLGGFDSERWVFLALSNFVIVSYIMLQRGTQPPGIRVFAGWFMAFALLFSTPLVYFDKLLPRAISATGIEHSIRHPDFFKFPTR